MGNGRLQIEWIKIYLWFPHDQTGRYPFWMIIVTKDLWNELMKFAREIASQKVNQLKKTCINDDSNKCISIEWWYVTEM